MTFIISLCIERETIFNLKPYCDSYQNCSIKKENIFFMSPSTTLKLLQQHNWKRFNQCEYFCNTMKVNARGLSLHTDAVLSLWSVKAFSSEKLLRMTEIMRKPLKTLGLMTVQTVFKIKLIVHKPNQL